MRAEGQPDEERHRPRRSRRWLIVVLIGVALVVGIQSAWSVRTLMYEHGHATSLPDVELVQSTMLAWMSSGLLLGFQSALILFCLGAASVLACSGPTTTTRIGK